MVTQVAQRLTRDPMRHLRDIRQLGQLFGVLLGEVDERVLIGARHQHDQLLAGDHVLAV